MPSVDMKNLRSAVGMKLKEGRFRRKTPSGPVEGIDLYFVGGLQITIGACEDGSLGVWKIQELGRITGPLERKIEFRLEDIFSLLGLQFREFVEQQARNYVRDNYKELSNPELSMRDFVDRCLSQVLSVEEGVPIEPENDEIDAEIDEILAEIEELRDLHRTMGE